VTSSRILRDDLYRSSLATDRVDRALDKLVKERLVRLTENDSQDAQVEVAHEALVRNWRQLVQWLEDERENMRRRLRLTAAAEQWDKHGRDPSTLRRGILLDEALSFDDLNELEKEFVAASQKAVEDAEREKEEARQRELTQARKLAELERERSEELTKINRRMRRIPWLVFLQAFLLIVGVVTFILDLQSDTMTPLSWIGAMSLCLFPVLSIAIVALALHSSWLGRGKAIKRLETILDNPNLHFKETQEQTERKASIMKRIKWGTIIFYLFFAGVLLLLERSGLSWFLLTAFILFRYVRK
jgi:hypothetical protein